MAFLLADILRAEQNLSVHLDQGIDQIVNRLEQAGIGARLPVADPEDVVAGSRLRLGRGGQSELVAARSDKVDRQIDLFLVRPFLAQLAERLIRTRDPVIPIADAQLSGRIRAADKRHRECSRRQRRGFDKRTPRQGRRHS